MELSEAARSLIEAPNLAIVVTLMPGGGPQATPLWVDHDGTHVLINTAEGRQKPRNLRRDPRIALCIVDRENTQHYVQVRGRVVEMIGGEAAFQHISKLGRKYSGPDHVYPRREGEERILVKILPEHVQVSGEARRRD